MKLSVIIVNYNVEYFLEQCLQSVDKALENISSEVYVVDNISVDGSCEMVRQKFPHVHLIANQENVGFSKANNQAMRIAKGEYMLLLNPDTVVEEDTFEKVIAFMDDHPEAGGLGVKMIDGKGIFLPESKRGLPTPAVAFYKIFGLSRIFPKSKKFGRYHLGFLPEDETNEIEILAGAFMLMRKTTLDKVGLLDEDFFMYGEDIDLSWRIIQGGYKNYYFPETRIIHYKGESTKKSSVNYVFVFYNAMVIFARKHFSEKNAKLFSFFINMAIWLRATVAIVNQFVRKAIVPFIDGIIVSGGLFGITFLYDHIYEKNYPNKLIGFALPIYTLVWLLSVFFSGGYDKPIKLLHILRGALLGTGIILSAYALLPKDLQFSRIIILLGAAWTTLALLGLRWLLHSAKLEGYHIGRKTNKRFLIVGDFEEAARVRNLLSQTLESPNCVGVVAPEKTENNGDALGNVEQLKEIVSIHHIDEIIFCSKNLSAQAIIEQMSNLDAKKLDFKIAPNESMFIIGSNSIETSGDLYVMDINSITKPKNLRNKRLFDFFTSLLLLVTLPISIWMVKRKIGFISNLFSVLFGRKSWIGYSKMSEEARFRLPRIKKGILTPADGIDSLENSLEIVERLNVVYVRNYRVNSDLQILLKGFKHLGRG